VEGKEASPGACSTWASAGLGVDLGVALGAEGGVGSLVVSLVGAWGAGWGPGGRRGGGVPVRGAYAYVQTAPMMPRHANKTKLRRTQTALRAREPHARTHTATPRNQQTKIGSQITAWGNSESRRRSRDQTPTQSRIRDADLRLRKPDQVP
jgi:hypothetical protein